MLEENIISIKTKSVDLRHKQNIIKCSPIYFRLIQPILHSTNRDKWLHYVIKCG